MRIVTLFFFAFSSCIYAQPGNPYSVTPSNSTALTTGIKIDIAVTNKETGAIIPGVELFVSRGDQSFRGKTDSLGHLVITQALAPGFPVSNANYMVQNMQAQDKYTWASQEFNSNSIPADSVLQFNLQLTERKIDESFDIEVFVVDDKTGKPVQGAAILVKREGTFVIEGTSDSLGRLFISRKLPGFARPEFSYTVEVKERVDNHTAGWGDFRGTDDKHEGVLTEIIKVNSWKNREANPYSVVQTTGSGEEHFSPGTISFAPGSFELDSADLSVINSIAQFMVQNPSHELILYIQHDGEGKKKLPRKRLKVITQKFIEMNVGKGRFIPELRLGPGEQDVVNFILVSDEYIPKN